MGGYPNEAGAVLSQIARTVFGYGPLYYLIQASTALILIFAVNTSFSDFPRLASILARDRFVPRQFANQGDRLVYSNGIVLLAGSAIVLLVIFQASDHHLMPLYAAGVFLKIHKHYLHLRDQLSFDGMQPPAHVNHTVLVPVAAIHRGVVQALQCARALSADVQAVAVNLDPEQMARLRERWPEFVPARWWEHLLHNQTALLIKGSLLFRPRTIVTSVPCHLQKQKIPNRTGPG